MRGAAGADLVGLGRRVRRPGGGGAAGAQDERAVGADLHTLVCDCVSKKIQNHFIVVFPMVYNLERLNS